MDDVTLIVCQPASDSAKTAVGDKVHSLPGKLHQVSSTELNQCLVGASTEFVAIASGPMVPAPDELRQSCELLRSDANLNLIVHFPRNDKDAVLAWRDVPTPLAVLRENPARPMASVLFKLSPRKEPTFQDVSDPIWDFLIRSATSPGSIQTRCISDDGRNATRDRTWPGLAPQPPSRSLNWLLSHLQAFSLEGLPAKVTSPPDAIALKAGLFQIHDYLDASHELSQSIEGKGRRSAGDYWHAIMHRREPDYSNAKYWFRHVGSHPVFARLAVAVDHSLSAAETSAALIARQKLLASGRWDPLAFVDFCQECTRGQDAQLTEIAEQIQWMEMQLLLEQTYRDATESAG